MLIYFSVTTPSLETVGIWEWKKIYFSNTLLFFSIRDGEMILFLRKFFCCLTLPTHTGACCH